MLAATTERGLRGVLTTYMATQSRLRPARAQLRHAQVVNETVVAPSTPLEIRITTNAIADLLTIEVGAHREGSRVRHGS